MAEITKELGRIPVSRGDYQTTTEYYKDNIVQYKRGSYQVVSESPIIGISPTNDKNVVNPGWTLFAGTLDAQDVVNQIKEQEAKSIQAVAAREAEILAKSDAAEVSFDNTGTSISETNVQDALKKTDGKLSKLESEVIYDVTANNDGATFPSLSVLLSSENLSTLIPTLVRHGGMSIRFVQSSDNKYVQFRLMTDSFSNIASNWQGVDDKPTVGSENLVKSDGVYKYAPATNIFTVGVPVEVNKTHQFRDIKAIQLISGHTYSIKAVLSTDYANTYIRFINIDTSSTVTFFLFHNATIDTTYYATESQEVMAVFYATEQESIGSATVDLKVIDITEETIYEKIELNNFLVNSTHVFESYIASIEVYLKDGVDASCSNLYIHYFNLSNDNYQFSLKKVSDDSLLFRKHFTGQPAEMWEELIGNVGFAHITFKDYPTDINMNSDATKNILSKSCFKHLTAPSDIRNAISFSDYVPINNNTAEIDANYKNFCKAIHGIKVYNLSSDKSIVISALKRYTNGNYLINIKDTSTNVVTQFGPQPIEDNVISLQYGDAIIRLWIDWNALTLDHLYAGYEIPIDFGVFEPSIPFDIISNNDPGAPFVLFDASRDYTESGYITSAGIAASNSEYVHSDYLKVTPLHTYVVSMDAFICAYTVSKTVIKDAGSQGLQGLDKQVVFTAPANCEYIIVSGKVVTEGRDKSYLKVIDYNHIYADIKSCNLLKWKPLNGKKVVVFADSIAGLNRAGWPLKLEERTGARVYNCGFPGARMEAISTDGTMDNLGTDPFAMCNLVDAIHDNDWSFQESSPLLSGSNKNYYRTSLDLLKTIDFNDIDIVLIAYGTNEIGWLPMDNEDDPDSKNTYAGATRYSLNRLMADYPNISVFLLTPIYRYNWGNDDTRDSDTHVHPTKGGTLIDNINTLKEVAHEYKVPCIDMYYELGVNIVNRDNYYLDGTHLNNNGLIRYADRIAAYIY